MGKLRRCRLMFYLLLNIEMFLIKTNNLNHNLKRQKKLKPWFEVLGF